MLPNMRNTLFVFGLLIVAIESLKTTDCPHPEESYPCYCEDEEEGSVMYCNNLEQNKQIVQALQNLKSYRLHGVAVWLFNNETIKSDAFKGPEINEITFTKSKVVLESPPFLGQENSLTQISFLNSFNEDTSFRSLSLGHLQNLKHISFEKNTIQVLKSDWLLSSGPSLKSITFDECKMEMLEDGVFSKVSTLTRIFVTNNLITSVSRSMFPKQAEELRLINLSGNKITSLPDDFFKNLPGLAYIDLEGNQLKTLDESLWSPNIEKLSRIYLKDNPIRCNKALKWISKKSLPKAFTGKCNEPAHLKGKEIRLLLPADFH